MGLRWYTKLGYWLCEKTDHLLIRKGWIYNGFYHRECRLCNRIISEPTTRTE